MPRGSLVGLCSLLEELNGTVLTAQEFAFARSCTGISESCISLLRRGAMSPHRH